jgi:hypothetical protein
VCLELVGVSLRRLLLNNLSLSLLEQTLLDLDIDTLGSLEEKISILEEHTELIDWDHQHSSSDFSRKSGSIYLLNERIYFFTDLLSLVSLALGLKICIVDHFERDLLNLLDQR